MIVHDLVQMRVIDSHFGLIARSLQLQAVIYINIMATFIIIETLFLLSFAMQNGIEFGVFQSTKRTRYIILLYLFAVIITEDTDPNILLLLQLL